MSFLFMDGADHLNSLADAQVKYWLVAGSLTFPTGRYGSGRALTSPFGQTQNQIPINTSSSTLIVGCAFQMNRGSTDFNVVIMDVSGSTMCSVVLNGLGQIMLSANSVTTRLTAQDTIKNLGVWHYIEVEIVFATTATGSASVWLEGVSVGSVSGIRTSSTSGTAPAMIQITGSALDDLYICDGAGTANNGPLGDSKVVYLAPSAAGANTNWTKVGSAGANYSSVNELSEDGDATYISSATVGQTDTYALGDLGVNDAAPKALQGVLLARGDVPTPRQITFTLKSGATTAQGGGLPLTPNYLYKLSVFETDPATGAAWTKTGVNALEAGATVSV